MPKLPDNRKFGLALSVGMALSSNVIGGLALGYVLDRWLKTSPWLIVAGLIFGTVSAFIAVNRIVSRLE